MRYEIIANGTTTNREFRPYFGDIVEMTLTDGSRLEGTIGRVSEDNRTYFVMNDGRKIDTAVPRDTVQDMHITRYSSHAIDALVYLEDRGYSVQRTIRRNIHEVDVPAVVAALEAQPNLSRVRAYPESF